MAPGRRPAPDDLPEQAAKRNGGPVAGRGRGWLRQFFQALGPGVVTGASDDDPSGIATYALAGASLGYGILWTAWVTFPLMAAVQYICAKIGLVAREGITGVLR